MARFKAGDHVKFEYNGQMLSGVIVQFAPSGHNVTVRDSYRDHFVVSLEDLEVWN